MARSNAALVPVEAAGDADQGTGGAPGAIDLGELGYHQYLQEQVATARTALAEAQAAWKCWAQYLVTQYGLDVAAGDDILPDGAIVRASAETKC